MPIARTRTFRSGNSEAIRLPKDLAFGEDTDLVVVRSGDVMTIYPAATSIAAMIKRLRRCRRHQPSSRETRKICPSGIGSERWPFFSTLMSPFIFGMATP